MVAFARLKLQGFKSFVEKTDLDIQHGLTGIVGPNGCGKSNLVEALRWVMGESSARKMRGDGMDDVIFNGTEKRPARSMAEVTLVIDNPNKTAPAPFTQWEQIEVSRKIQRESGSDYKMNGKSARARDVQTFFADIMGGHTSPFLVSQGRITEMITARPAQRRQVLEDAAGVSGLYARRQEAETRLRATDQNLTRVKDSLGGLETRYQTLKRQAKQAEKYREYNQLIRDLDMVIAWIEWAQLLERRKDLQHAFEECDQNLANLMLESQKQTQARDALNEQVETLKREEILAQGKKSSLEMRLSHMKNQEKQRIEKQTELEGAWQQLIQDQQYMTQNLQDLRARIEALEQEKIQIEAAQNENESHLKSLHDAVDKAQEDLTQKDQTYQAAHTEFLQARMGYDQILQREKEAQTQLSTLLRQEQGLKDRLESLKNDLNHLDDMAAIEAELSQIQTDKTALDNRVKADQERVKDLESTLTKDRQTEAQYTQNKAALEGEYKTLKSVTDLYQDHAFAPVITGLKTKQGYENALSRALGEGLMASIQDNAPLQWQDAKDHDPAPLPPALQNLKTLSDFCEGEGAVLGRLKHALNAVLVTDSKDIAPLIAALPRGYSLVSIDGALWRWDGFHARAESGDRIAQYLQQKNRLQALAPMLQEVTENLTLTQTENQQNAALLKQHRQSIEQATQSIQKINQAQKGIEQRKMALDKKQFELQTLINRYEKEYQDITQSRITLETETLPPLTAQKQNFDGDYFTRQERIVQDHKTALDTARTTHQQAQLDARTHQDNQNRQKARHQAMQDDLISLRNKKIHDTERQQKMQARETELTEKRDALATQISVADEIAALQDQITHMDRDYQATLTRFLESRDALKSLNDFTQSIQEQINNGREQRAHFNALFQAVNEDMAKTEITLSERFDQSPTQIHHHVTTHLPDYALNIVDLERYKKERDSTHQKREQIGGVNLRAEEECIEIEQELGLILSEHEDLTKAVEELRSAIDKLNKEAKSRIQTAFTLINGYFSNIFVRLFGGGQAYLKLIEFDSETDSGLEIYAQPPGKSLQSLSLLSGGEQTMTAIALIFAMFMANPSPICVLDEVDAPLDDANVDRFCDLLDEFAAKGLTRFLVITHHRLTMARMDCLYGVTMREKGVSQLISMDIQQQLAFMDEVAA